MTPAEKKDLIANFSAFINRNSYERFFDLSDKAVAIYIVTCLENLEKDS